MYVCIKIYSLENKGPLTLVGVGEKVARQLFFFAASPNMFKDQENTYLVELI